MSPISKTTSCEGTTRVSERTYSSRNPELTVFLHHSLNRRLDQPKRRSEHIQIMIERQRIPQLPLSVEPGKVSLADMVKLGVDPVKQRFSRHW